MVRILAETFTDASFVSMSESSAFGRDACIFVYIYNHV